MGSIQYSEATMHGRFIIFDATLLVKFDYLELFSRRLLMSSKQILKSIKLPTFVIQNPKICPEVAAEC